MIQINGTWMPDESASINPLHKPSVRASDLDASGAYRLHRLSRALTHCKSYRCAVDVGAHVGLWTQVLSERFEHVFAFEPMPDHVECFRRNVTGKNVSLRVAAVGDRDGTTKMMAGPNVTVRVATAGGFADADIVRLDSLNIGRVDFVKIDVDGYEPMVLAGAKGLLEKNRPVVLVEMKPTCLIRYKLSPDATMHAMQDMGASWLWSDGVDHCFAWLPSGG